MASPWLAHAFSRFRTQSTLRNAQRLEGYKVIYEGASRVQPLWSRWAYFMLGINVFWAGNMGTAVLDRWRQRVEIETDDGGPPVEDWEMRPLWQRGAAAALCLGLGAGSCIVVLLARSRSVSRILIRHADARVMVEGAGTRPGKGRVFPMKDCSIAPARADDELALHVKGIKLEFWPFLIRLKKCDVPGTDMNSSIWEKRRAFMQLWDNRQYAVRRVGATSKKTKA
ncbi:hypothetical protein AURDEDRAFT_184163 [Auricularia subglabra TFB-10046 SS5]|nr:hypothetical protein AURDEDRAFT_184163 [Auricularia subglabra TFB-10046 SS5]